MILACQGQHQSSSRSSTSNSLLPIVHKPKVHNKRMSLNTHSIRLTDSGWMKWRFQPLSFSSFTLDSNFPLELPKSTPSKPPLYDILSILLILGIWSYALKTIGSEYLFNCSAVYRLKIILANLISMTFPPSLVPSLRWAFRQYAPCFTNTTSNN